MYRTARAPMNIQFEITSICNERCIHCYNYWRSEMDPSGNTNMPRELFDRCLDEIIQCNVLHVIFTGGEPLFNFDVLLHGIQRATEAGLSVSCNSNLLLATPEKLRMLRQAGLPHILTSLNSHDPETNDRIVSHQNAFQKITRGISWALESGIKISTNMIISKNNIHDIYETGRLSHTLGAKKFHVTRVIPPSYIPDDQKGDFKVNHEELDLILEQITALRDDFPIEVKTLIPIPLCALKDLERYANLVGRPCAAGKRSMSVDSRGRAHACWHMVQDYGDITKIGLKRSWADMGEWRSGELIPESCRECPYLPMCGAGCRLSGQAFYGELSDPDNLRLGWENITRPYTGRTGVDDMVTDLENILRQYEGSLTPEVLAGIENGTFRIARGLRIRDEKGFSIINIMAGTSFFLEKKYADLLKALNEKKEFRLSEIGNEHRQIMAYLFVKQALERL